VMMPVMDGLAATRAIRALPTAAAEIPIIGLTAAASATDEQACRTAGMNGFITKPLRGSDLHAAIAAAMRADALTTDSRLR
jgi:CheY-like chemotaxis protein